MAATVSGQETIEALSAPARSLLFAPLGPTDAPSAVVQRLRAAISLGLRSDGRRLPKEAVLAAQLGVTNFALREALSELRKQGLLATRAGKYGGSFVTYPAHTQELERDALARMSTPELRDLGDWRQMLAVHAAVLATHRASASNLRVLSQLADQVAQAPGGHEARRAHGRFFLELASAAQSMRITRAEFAVHEQIDWLFVLTMESADERRNVGESLNGIVKSLRKRQVSRSRTLAADHISRLLDRLTQVRLELIASRGRTATSRATTLADELRSVVDGLIGPLQAFAKDVAPSLDEGREFATVRSRLSVAGLRQFDTVPAFVTGMGTLVDVDVMPGHPYWIEWWQRTDQGPATDNHHVLDPSREDFYDYPSREFMTMPKSTHRPFAQGPYVDYGGADDYILTIAVPVLADDQFLGVTCLDLLVADLEAWLAPWLATSGEVQLVNRDGRVVISNSLSSASGDVFDPAGRVPIVELSDLEWTLYGQEPNLRS